MILSDASTDDDVVDDDDDESVGRLWSKHELSHHNIVTCVSFHKLLSKAPIGVSRRRIVFCRHIDRTSVDDVDVGIQSDSVVLILLSSLDDDDDDDEVTKRRGIQVV